ncbi:MAG TPA: hypothetical protein VLU38_01520, partial [Methanomassiliicoccales archaeon]|nr:hypothetical protein [Methanomassiliicoccales archaeon]
MTYKCPRCGLVYEKEESCPLCGWSINAPFVPDKRIHKSIPNFRCPERGEEMEHGYDNFFEQLAERLMGRGFWVTRKVGTGNDRYDLFASRRDIGPFRNQCFYIIAASLEAVDGKMFREYAKRAFKFGLAHRHPHRPRGLGGSLVFFPVIVSNNITDELKKWLAKSMP